ncbi:MAG: HDOD domain-containing protein [Phycisphaerae bacterium]
MNEEILDMIVRSAAVPTMPQVVTRFLELSGEKDFKVKDLVAVLNTDPGISGELLRLTNSPLFGVTRKVTSLQQAMTLLGMKRVRSLVLGRYLTEGVGKSGKDTGDFSLSYYWRRSLSTAVLAAKFADHVASRYREEAFLGGLLCDVGVVVMVEALSEKYAPIAAHYSPMCADDFVQQERTTLDLTHADVSALVLDKWMLPPTVVEAVRHHHAPSIGDGVDEPAGTLARILSGAGRIAKLLCESPDKDAAVETCTSAMNTVGLDVAALQRALSDIEKEIGEFAQLLRTDIIQSGIYARISQIIVEELAGEAAVS